jgi:hypothetical protein
MPPTISLNGNVALAQIDWNSQINLIQTGARKSDERRLNQDLIDVKADHSYLTGASPEKGFPARTTGVVGPEPEGEEFNVSPACAATVG